MPEKAKISKNHYGLFNQDVFIEWKPEYNLGIPIIDEQHRGIVTTINSLYYGMQNNHGEDMLTPVIAMVHEYTYLHFEVEEDFLRYYKYPNLKQHQELHSELVDELSIIKEKSMWDQDPQKFLEFLKKWWIEHICENDREFLKYLIATLR